MTRHVRIVGFAHGQKIMAIKGLRAVFVLSLLDAKEAVERPTALKARLTAREWRAAKLVLERHGVLFDEIPAWRTVRAQVRSLGGSSIIGEAGANPSLRSPFNVLGRPWQDLVFAACQVVFLIALVPLLWSNANVPPFTGLSTAGALCVFSVAQWSYRNWITVALGLTTATIWALLGFGVGL